MNIGKWFKNITFFNKLIVVYVIFAILPMILVTGYNNQKTKSILLEESYRNMQQSLSQINQNLNSAFGSYETVMNILYTNQMFNAYLVKDYTNSDFWEMFSFIDKLLSNIMLVNPDISRVSMYCSNETLLHDNYYFYRLEELNEDWFNLASGAKGNIMAAGIRERNKKNYVVLERRLNYYHYGSVGNILLMEIDSDTLSNQIKISSKNQEVYLVNDQGQILASSDKGIIGGNMADITEEWQSIPEDHNGISLKFPDASKVCIASGGPLGMKLIMMTNQENLVEATKKVSRDIITIFLISSFSMFLANYFYSLWIASRVNKVVYVAKNLGEGKFDYRLKDMGSDEIGVISDAINTLNDRIQLLIEENYEKKLKIKSSEMNLLQEQINPHFLYNALSVISSMAQRESDRKTMLSVRYLADFYRISLNKGKQIVSVQEEVELLKNYMRIQLIRFEDTIDIEYEVERRALPFRTIKLLLQPLVENAIHHGRKDEEEMLHIKVNVSLDKDCVIYEVKDDGIGIEAEKLEKLRSELEQSEEGYGLKNVDIRVKMNYGEQYGVVIESVYGEGTTVKVVIPQVFS